MHSDNRHETTRKKRTIEETWMDAVNRDVQWWDWKERWRMLEGDCKEPSMDIAATSDDGTRRGVEAAQYIHIPANLREELHSLRISKIEGSRQIVSYCPDIIVSNFTHGRSYKCLHRKCLGPCDQPPIYTKVHICPVNIWKPIFSLP